MNTPTVQKQTTVKEEIQASSDVGHGVRPQTLAVTLAGLAGLGIVVWMARPSSKKPMKTIAPLDEPPLEYVGYMPMGR